MDTFELSVMHGSGCSFVTFAVPEKELRSAVGNHAELEALAHRYLMPALANLLRATYGWECDGSAAGS